MVSPEASAFAFASVLVALSLGGCIGITSSTGGPDDPVPSGVQGADPDVGDRPHVVVGVSDTGINPYHEAFHRPDRTDHPCTYIPDLPCDIPVLNLTLPADDYDKALERDRTVWENVTKDQWYWIPETPFVAVRCTSRTTGPIEKCILGEGDTLTDRGGHGVGTTYSVLAENPDASIASEVSEGDHEGFIQAGIPVDVYSISWGHVVPLPVPEPLSESAYPPIYVKGARNDVGSTLLDSWDGDPEVITVGGALWEPAGPTTDGRWDEVVTSGDQPDVVSYYCRPVAVSGSTDGYDQNCGNSFGTPTVAGGLSKVILQLRRHSGYTGNTVNGTVDPVLDLTQRDIRDAMNRTASYEPTPRYVLERGDLYAPYYAPLNPAAPWLQWGWGLYDGWVANRTIDHLLGQDEVPAKPDQARTYMEAVHQGRQLLYGS